MEDNYSVMCLKKAAFVDELNNYLTLLSPDPSNDVIIKYLQSRIAQLDIAMKKY